MREPANIVGQVRSGRLCLLHILLRHSCYYTIIHAACQTMYFHRIEPYLLWISSIRITRVCCVWLHVLLFCVKNAYTVIGHQDARKIGYVISDK